MNEVVLEENGRAVDLMQLEWLQDDVQSKVRSQVRNLRVLYQRGGIVLRGTSFSFYGKQLAQEAVMAVSDLPLVANEIQVI